ncbi:hypothetical protein GCM10011581_20480 [Saccharopolyspora subtropica]|uniref:Uncharacterized protein n=1 Tax=Saccharopolyspora thermophila TaxID=89367 RepID=A0A917JUQ9_9PSEU|nr:hypothetical protein [Saccharopolyspora subtropica]GGI83138.1 hypothetical protein GCM10011581_20480 [Saccharopolyspora subtropica]
MARGDDRTEAARPWRLLTRALVVVGATVAGTSAAWLLGTGLPADAADLRPAAADSAEQPAAPEPADARTGPANFSLGGLDPLGLVRSDAQRLLDAAQPVTGVLRDSSAEIHQVAHGALTTTSAGANSLSESVDSGLSELGEPLLSGASSSAAPDAPPPQQSPVLDARPAPPVPQLSAPTRSAEQSESTPEQHTPEPAPELPGVPPLFHLPAPTGAPGCGGAADGPLHGTTALGCHPAAPVAAPALRSAPTHDTADALTGVPEPQPGTTPD